VKRITKTAEDIDVIYHRNQVTLSPKTIRKAKKRMRRYERQAGKKALRKGWD